MHRLFRWTLSLILAVFYVGTTWADEEDCRQAVREQETARAVALREAEDYAACLSLRGLEDPCKTEFRRLAAAHSELGTVAWERPRECS